MMVSAARWGIAIDEFARVIAEIAQTLESPRDTDTRITHVLCLVESLIPYDCCALLRRTAAGQPRVVAVPGCEPGADGRAAFMENLLHFMEGETPRSRPFQSAAHLAVPVIGGDEIIGVLLVERNTRDEFETHHLRCLTAVASQLGSYLTLARLQEESVRNARFREEFIGVIGHDLRNPVSAITTGAHALLKREGLGAHESSIVARIASSAQRVTHMLDDLSDFTRGRLGGGIRIIRERLNLRDICSRVIEEFQIGRPACSIVVRANGDLEGDWDSERLSQVLSNLLGNALDHGDATVPVRIELAGDSSTVSIRVINHGGTIPEWELRGLFEPFRRGRGSDASTRRGLGLGLYIVDQIVTSHGGTVSVRSDDVQGTCFTVALPRTA